MTIIPKSFMIMENLTVLLLLNKALLFKIKYFFYKVGNTATIPNRFERSGAGTNQERKRRGTQLDCSP